MVATVAGVADGVVVIPAKLAADIPIGRVATTEEIAAVITFLSSQDAGYLTGTTVDINGGSHIH